MRHSHDEHFFGRHHHPLAKAMKWQRRMLAGALQGFDREAGDEQEAGGERQGFGPRGPGGPFGFPGGFPFGGPGGGPGGFGGFGGPGGPFGGHPLRNWRGPRVKRGDVRSSILTLLAEQPRNGYQLIQAIGERSGGRWKPSPGAVYPALQQLEDEGLIRAEESDGKKVFALSESGEAAVKAQDEESVPAWETMADAIPDELQEMHQLMGQIMGAGMMVAQAGNEDQQARARKLLKQTRRTLYQILGEDEDDEA